MHATVSDIIIIIIRQVAFLVTVRVVRDFPKDLSSVVVRAQLTLTTNGVQDYKRGRRRQRGALDKVGAQTG